MQIDFKKAFSYPFTSEGKIKKLIIGFTLVLFSPILQSIIEGLKQISPGTIKSGVINPVSLIGIVITIIALVIPILLIGLLVTFATNGYIITAAHNEINDKTPLLPNWEIKNCLINGFKFSALVFVYMLIFLAIVLPLAIISGVILAITHLALPLIIIVEIIAIVIYFIAAILLNFAANSYAEKFSFKAGFDLKKIFKGASKVIPEYVLISLILIGFFLISAVMILSQMDIMTFIHNPKAYHPQPMGLIYYIAVIYNFILMLISYNLFAQIYKLGISRSQSKDPAIQENK